MNSHCLTPQQRRTLVAAIDRIIPADDYPSASQAGVDVYIERQLAGDLAHRAIEVCEGLNGLDAESLASFDRHFDELDELRQDRTLAALEREEIAAVWSVSAPEFFRLLIELTTEGYYADPANGGNRGALSWKMIVWEPGIPAGEADR
jgi:hypothetical protein